MAKQTDLEAQQQLIDYDFAKLREIANEDDLPRNGRFLIVADAFYSRLGAIAKTISWIPATAQRAIEKGCAFIRENKPQQWMLGVLVADALFEFDAKYLQNKNSQTIIKTILPVYQRKDVSVQSSSVDLLLSACATLQRCEARYGVVDYMTRGYIHNCDTGKENYLAYAPLLMTLADGDEARQARVMQVGLDNAGMPQTAYVASGYPQLIDMTRRYPLFAQTALEIVAKNSLTDAGNNHQLEVCQAILNRAKDEPTLMQAILPTLENCVVAWSFAAPKAALDLAGHIQKAMADYIGGPEQDLVCHSFMLLAKPSEAGADVLVVFGATADDALIVSGEPPISPAATMRALEKQARRMLEVTDLTAAAQEVRGKGQLPDLVELVRAATPAP
jgi:hypothetical protein